MQGLWSLIGKMGSAAQNFPYEIGDKVGDLESKSSWSLHQGKKKGTGEVVSVFVLDVKASSEEKIQIAKAALRRLKTLRHPNILRFIDGLEADTVIYMVTEPVVPLEVHLAEDDSAKSNMAVSWGIHQTAAGLGFLVNDCNLSHGNICMSSIFVDVAGEWKLSGVEYVRPVDPPSKSEASADLTRMPNLQVYDPPEGRKYSKGSKRIEKWSADMWGLGCLIWEVYNGALSRAGSLKSVGKIPKAILADYAELVSANPKSRPNPSKFLQTCRTNGHFLQNSFVDANLFLQEIQIKDPKEQKKFFSSLSPSLDKFPKQFCKHRILPQLLNAYEFGSAGSAVLSPLFKVGKLLDENEYQQKIVPCVVKLFSSTDRATRIHLLQQLEQFIENLKPSTVDEQIFPNVALGFGDTVPAMREQTVKAMMLLAPKLSEKTLSNQLLKYFAKLQMDQEPGIRTNTTVCLGKIANHLPEATRHKVLVSAFLRALRDPFPPARTAGVMAFCSTSDFYNLKECATRILPALCTLTVDPEKKVRVQVFKVIHVLLRKLEKTSDEPDSAASQTETSQLASTSSAGASWTGWAVSSLTSKLYKGGSTSREPAAAAADGASSSAAVEAGSSDQPQGSAPKQDVHPGQQRKVPKEEEAANESGSDYGGGWGEDDWEDTEETDVGQLRQGLLAAKEECPRSLQHPPQEKISPKQPSPPAERDLASDNDSGSDYGDWENDDWSRDPFSVSSTAGRVSGNKTKMENPPSGSAHRTSQPPKKNDGISANKGDWDEHWDDILSSTKAKTSAPAASSDKSKVQDSSYPVFTMKTDDTNEWSDGDWSSLGATTKPASSSKQTASSGGIGDEPELDNWGTGDWGSQDAVGTKPSASEKAELARKKREERKQQRQQVLREKRSATGRGPLKLGTKKAID